MLVDRVVEVLRQDGWTCEYHEPVSGPGECSQCDDAHRRTAERVAELFTEEWSVQIRSGDGHPLDGMWSDPTPVKPNLEPDMHAASRSVSEWTAVKDRP